MAQSRVIDSKYAITDYTDEKSLLQGEVVKIMDNLVFKKIRDYYAEKSKDETETLPVDKMAKDIVNIVVPQDKGSETVYRNLADIGFTINEVEMKRIISGSGQIRRNTISFIRKELYDYVLNALLCGLTLEDFGEDFNAAKFNAYLGLNMSGSLLLKDFPKVCVIDDYEEIVPEIKVNYIKSEEIKFLVLPDGDYKLEEVKDDFIFYDNGNNETENLEDAKTAIRKSDIAKENPTIWNVFFGMRKYPEIIEYSKIGQKEGEKQAPPLNSFDGQGLANPKWVKKVSEELGFCKLNENQELLSGYIPSQMIIRAPWVKGLVATFPISDYLKKRGVNTVISLCGDVMNVDDVDIFISKSQFKMYKIYKKKVEALGCDMTAWEYHQKAMSDNGLVWGVVMPNKKYDDSEKESNYQYNQALNLNTDEDIDKLSEKTETFLRKLCTHDIKYVYDTLVTHKQTETEETCNGDELEDEIEQSESVYQTQLQKVVSHNIDMLNDKYIQSLINKECQREFKKAMLGKLTFDGNFQFIVSDPLAQAEWIYKNHAVDENGNHPDIEVKGVIGAGQIYSNYWKKLSKKNGKKSEQIVLMRSPLIDQHEIVKADLIMSDIPEFQYLQSGIVLSIHDLFTLQMQNCDFDGDRCFSSDMDILKKGCLEKAYPLYFEPGEGSITGKINDENIIEADVRGLNSKVGQFSNKSTSFYAMLPLYKEDSKENKTIRESITVLGEVVGTEIDKIKTGIKPVQPYNWKPIQVAHNQREHDGKIEKVSVYSKEQEKAIYHHNDLVPDKKPYFFRYNYSYLDKDVKTLENEIGKECKYNYGMKLQQFLDKYDNEEFYNRVKSLFRKAEEYRNQNGQIYQFIGEELFEVMIYSTLCKYKKAYPVLDTPCIMNKICHKFENLYKELGDFNDGKNLLKDYRINNMSLEESVKNEITSYMSAYKKHRKFITKNNNTSNDSNNKQIAKETKEKLDGLLEQVKKNIYGLFEEGCDKKIILTYLLSILKGDDVQFVWMIMDDDLLEIIPEKQYKEEGSR